MPFISIKLWKTKRAEMAHESASFIFGRPFSIRFFLLLFAEKFKWKWVQVLRRFKKLQINFLRRARYICRYQWRAVHGVDAMHPYYFKHLEYFHKYIRGSLNFQIIIRYLKYTDSASLMKTRARAWLAYKNFNRLKTRLPH